MANGIKYQAHEILNKVLNSAETGLQVDIVAGAEYAEDASQYYFIITQNLMRYLQ